MLTATPVRKRLPLLVIMILVVLAVGLFFKIYLKVQADNSLTLDLVISAFRNAGFAVTDLQTVHDFPGPILTGESGVRFSSETDGETLHVYVIAYANRKSARQSVSAVNDMRNRIGPRYACGFGRGSIAVVIIPCVQEVADEYHTVFEAVEP